MLGLGVAMIVVLTCLLRRDTYVNIYRNVLYEVDDFLTHEECDELIRMSHDNLENSLVYSTTEDLHDTSQRNSKQAWLTDDQSPVVKKVSDKVAALTGTDVGLQESLQVVQYPAGGFFKPHFDACGGDAEECERMNGALGPRRITVLVYLNDDYQGGGTTFPKLGVTVTPKKGKAAVFYSVDEEGSIIPESEHGGDPVIAGQKWICNKWVRLGKR